MRRGVFVVAWTVLSLAQPARADTDVDVQGWLVNVVNARVPDTQIRAFLEVQPRFRDDVTRLDKILLRGGVGWALTPELSVWFGYAWQPLFSPYRNEQRPFQQFLAAHELGPVQLTNRTRLEERFIEDASGVSVRVRHLVRAVWQPAEELPWLRLAASEEFFLNLTGVSNGPALGPDQNRFFVGPHFRLAKELNVELGYMANYLWKSGDDQLNHIALLAVNLSL